MDEIKLLAEQISGSIQSAKASMSRPDLAQPLFFRTMLRLHFNYLPDDWAASSKRYVKSEEVPALEELTQLLNLDIQEALSYPDRHYIYQLLLRLTVVIYGIEGVHQRSSGSSGGPFF